MESVEFVVSSEEAGQRLDVFLARRLPEHSRAALRRAIQARGVTVDGQHPKVAYRLGAGQKVSVVIPELPDQGPQPENIPLEILYEDESLVVINKPAGMVVHPAKGHWSGTLTSALAYHFQSLSSVGGPTRPGIVHRLDRETSGVMVVAKNDQTHLALAEQFAQRKVEKEYIALVAGVVDRDQDVIETSIGPHPDHREKMAIRKGHPASRDAHTRYHVIERLAGVTQVRVFPRTGRTHQIRVHLAHIGHPILCDRLYGGRSTLTLAEMGHTAWMLTPRGHPGAEGDKVLLDRLALHARRLKFAHPAGGRSLVFEAPLPGDLAGVLETLRGEAR